MTTTGPQPPTNQPGPPDDSDKGGAEGNRVSMEADFDFQALAERLLALMKKEARLEQERLGRNSSRMAKVRDVN